MKKRYKGDAFEAIDSNIEGMYRAGTVDKATMRRFDESCLLAPVVMKPAEIKKIREG